MARHHYGQRVGAVCARDGMHRPLALQRVSYALVISRLTEWDLYQHFPNMYLPCIADKQERNVKAPSFLCEIFLYLRFRRVQQGIIALDESGFKLRGDPLIDDAARSAILPITQAQLLLINAQNQLA